MNNIYEKVGRQVGLDSKVVRQVYEAYWTFIRNTIENMTLDQDISIEEFENMKTSFSIPSLGKLFIPYFKLKAINKQREKTNDFKYKKDKTNV